MESLPRVANLAQQRLEYAAAVTCMDDAIGEVLQLLDQYRIADETLVVFFSDNGGGGGSDNAPLRGGKSKMFEGGIRVPCIVRYPRIIPAGTTSDAFLSSLEIVPTLLAATGLEAPSDLVLDGFNVLPVLAGNTPSPRSKMFWQRRDDKAARVGDWKWVESAAGHGLFNLSTDIGERHDVSLQQPERLQEIKDHFRQWQAEMQAAEPAAPSATFSTLSRLRIRVGPGECMTSPLSDAGCAQSGFL